MSKENEITIRDLIQFLYELFPSKDAEKWDNKQLINPKFMNTRPRAITCGLDLCQRDLVKLKQTKTNFVICHHPLWINARINDLGARAIKRFLVANKIVFLALHTQFDKSYFGTNLQIIKRIPLFKLTSVVKHGFVSYVELFKKINLHELIESLKANLDLNQCKFRFNQDTSEISRVAVCSGSGYDLVKKVNWKKADVFISGDLKYHDWVNAERNQLNIIDIGHETEGVFGNYLKSLIENNFGLPVNLLDNKPLYMTK